MTPTAILIVAAEPAFGNPLAEQLAADGFEALVARTVDHARSLAAGHGAGLVVLGDLDGPRGPLELLAEIRAGGGAEARCDPTLPILVVSSRSSELDLLRAFEAGADDFVGRDTGYLELRARVRALLHRAQPRADERARVVRVGALEVDTGTHSVRVRERPVALCRREYDLLLHMAAEPERVFTKEELLRSVWGFRAAGNTRTLDSHASRLRRKLGAAGDRWVVNVWGVGYRLVA